MTASSGRATSRVVTLTMNPALDITTGTEEVRHTDKIRCGPARHDPGGGGINVARVAAALGAPACAVFPVGGLTGERIVELLEREGIQQRHVQIAPLTRESLTVDEFSTGLQYRFVLPGPALSYLEQAACLEALDGVARDADFVVASGSLPPGVPVDFYNRISVMCREFGASFILDTSGGGLTHVSGVYLLKPSLRELRECTGRALITEDEQLAAAHDIIEGGSAANVLISRGSRRQPARDSRRQLPLSGARQLAWQRRRGRRRVGGWNHRRTVQGVATARLGPARDGGGGSHAAHPGYRDVSGGRRLGRLFDCTETPRRARRA